MKCGRKEKRHCIYPTFLLVIQQHRCENCTFNISEIPEKAFSMFLLFNPTS